MNDRRHHSLFKKIIIPLIIIMLVQSVVFFCATFYGGISATLNENADNILTERVINQKKTIETKFTTQWTSFDTPGNNIDQIYRTVEQNYGKKIYTDTELQKEVLFQSADTLVRMLRDNEVTGVFLILNNSKDYEPLEEGDSQSRYGICIRDYAPTSEYTDKEDLLIVRGPSSLMSSIGIAMETWWDAMFTFNEKTPGDYYCKPMALAYEYPDADSRDLAYFDGVHKFGGSDREVVSYSIPLRDETGYPYGVLGIELTVDYLKTLIPSSALYSDNSGCYALVQYETGQDEMNVVAYDGILFQRYFGKETTFSAQREKNGMVEYTGTQMKKALRGSVSEIQIYNHNTPYENQKLALLGMVEKDALYGINAIVRKRLLGVSVIVMVLGCLSVLLASKRLTRPINRLSEKVRSMDGATVQRLEHLNIDEIDDLVESIEELSDKVNRTVIRTEFFSRMSHDMRTPMNAIIGFSSPEMLESADSKQMLDYMEKIHSSGNYLLSLINEVLDMTKIETKRMELRENPITQRDYTDAVLPIIRELAKEKKVSFTVEIEESQTRFYGDSQRLSQILMNLLSNAVKFAGENGNVRLQIHEQADGKDGIINHFLIQDDGCGMSEEFQKKMYEPFSQEGFANGGTGLGLSIARQIVTLMGGTITCESEKGRGTSFTVSVPARIVPEEVPGKAPEQKRGKDGEAVDISGQRILLCEDHPMNAQIARHLLERRGLIVEEAHDGEEALEQFKASEPGTYGLILMDIRMPRLNGLQATARIRELQRTDAATVPIVAMTANAFKEDMEETRRAGMNEHLSKPIDPAKLYKVLEKYLGA